MFLYSFLSEPVDLVVYRSQPPVTLQSGVLKLRAPVTASKSWTGRYCGDVSVGVRALCYKRELR